MQTQQLVMAPSKIKEIRSKVIYRIAILQSQKATALESFIENPWSNISICQLRHESLEILLECWINQSRVACNLVTNFEVALIKKLW